MKLLIEYGMFLVEVFTCLSHLYKIIMPIQINYSNCCWQHGQCQSCSCGQPAGACVGCVEACPVGAITRGERVEIDAGKCIDCGACVAACKHGALVITV